MKQSVRILSIITLLLCVNTFAEYKYPYVKVMTNKHACRGVGDTIIVLEDLNGDSVKDSVFKWGTLVDKKPTEVFAVKYSTDSVKRVIYKGSGGFDYVTQFHLINDIDGNGYKDFSFIVYDDCSVDKIIVLNHVDSFVVKFSYHDYMDNDRFCIDHKAIIAADHSDGDVPINDTLVRWDESLQYYVNKNNQKVTVHNTHNIPAE